MAAASCGLLPPVTARQAEFYDPAEVQAIALEVAQADQDRMNAALPERILVPGTFRWKDVSLSRVGVRYKGNSSSAPGARHKRSFLVDFDGFVAGQKFLGMGSVALDNGIQFGGLFSERLLTDILRQEGVPVSRANYARLLVNGRYMGLYVNVERINKSFLRRNFASDDGNLYKCDEGGPAANLAYLGDDPAAYAKAFEPKTNEGAGADLRDLVAFIKALARTSDADIKAALESRFEVDRLLRLASVMLMGGAFDQYTGFAAHNYYLYRDPGTGRWSYLPWDLDVGFADNAFGRIPVIDGWNAAYPLPVVPRPLLERIIAQPAWLAAYRGHAANHLERHFHPEVLGARLDVLYAQARPHLADDPFPPLRITNPDDTGWDGIVSSLKDFMHRRYDRAKAELADPKVTPPLDQGPSGVGPPPPGPTSPFDPTNLRVVSAGSSRVDLAWTNNAPDALAVIVQKCAGTDCAAFTNAIGLPGADSTSATDTGVGPGATYRYRVYAVRPGPARPTGTGPSNVVTSVVSP